MRNKLIVFLAIVTITFLFSFPSCAAGSARSIALGDDFAILTGPAALSANPAAVNISGKKFSLGLNMNGEFWNNLLLNDYLDDGKKDDLLKIARHNGMIISSTAKLGGNISYRPVTIFAGGSGEGLLNLSPDLAELLLKGNEAEGKYQLTGTAGSSAFYLDTAVNFSYRLADSITGDKINNIYLGFTYHYLNGALAKMKGNGVLDIHYKQDGTPVVDDSNADLKAYYSSAEDTNDLARGQAFDLGVYYDINDKYSFAASILNLAGSLTADRVKEYSYKVYYNDGTEEWETEEKDGSIKKERIVLALPLRIKVAGKMRYSKNLDLLANYTMTSYRDSIYNKNLIDHKFSLAAEMTKLKYLPLRLGINYSTLERNFNISTGLGLYLGAVRFDLGISDLSGLFYHSKGVAGGLDFTLVF